MNVLPPLPCRKPTDAGSYSRLRSRYRAIAQNATWQFVFSFAAVKNVTGGHTGQQALSHGESYSTATPRFDAWKDSPAAYAFPAPSAPSLTSARVQNEACGERLRNDRRAFSACKFAGFFNVGNGPWRCNEGAAAIRPPPYQTVGLLLEAWRRKALVTRRFYPSARCRAARRTTGCDCSWAYRRPSRCAEPCSRPVHRRRLGGAPGPPRRPSRTSSARPPA